MTVRTLSSPSSSIHTRSGWSVPGVVLVTLGGLLYLTGWVLLMSGVGQYLLLPGLALCALGGWLLRGWRGALVAPVLAVFAGIVLLVLTNATAAGWHELRDSGTPVVQTPSPKR